MPAVEIGEEGAPGGRDPLEPAPEAPFRPEPGPRWRALASGWAPSWAQLAVLAGIFVVALHFWQLEAAPSGFYVDEAGIGLAARGMALDARDDHAVAWPLFFESFGDWKNPVEIYLVAAAVKLFGPTITVIRAVPSALSLLTAALLAVLVWDLFRRRWLAIATFLVGAVVPWLFVVGRLGFEVPAQPACLAAFLLFWRRAVDRRSFGYAAAGGVALGLSAYAYSTGRLFIFLVVLGMIVAEAPWARGRLLFVCAITGLAVWAPAVIWNQAHDFALTARFGGLSITNDAHGLGDLASRFWHVYTSYFSPDFLFDSRQFYMGGGMLLVSLVPVLILGLASIWWHRHDPFWRLVILGVILGPVPAALTTDFGHYLRDSESAPFWLLIAALGAYEGWRSIQPGRVWVAAALALALTLESGWFMADYFGRYPARISDWNDEGLGTAVTAANREAHSPGANGKVVVSSSILGGDILYAWYAQEDLSTYRLSGLDGIGVQYQPIAGPLAPGTVAITGPSESVPEADVVTSVTLTSTDDWGHPQARTAFQVWLARPAAGS